MTELGNVKLGFGTWAMGGPFLGPDGSQVGWGPADDAESSKALQRAFELGVTALSRTEPDAAASVERELDASSMSMPQAGYPQVGVPPLAGLPPREWRVC